MRVAVSLTGQARPKVSGVLMILLLGLVAGYTMAGTKDGEHPPALCAERAVPLRGQAAQSNCVQPWGTLPGTQQAMCLDHAPPYPEGPTRL